MIVETNKNASTGKYEVDIKTNGVVAELEANKEISIDVSNYSEPVEITPSSGKDGMEKATITLTNISSGGSTTTAYGWEISGTPYWFDIDIAPNNDAEVAALKTITFNISEGAVLSVDISTMPGNPTLTTRTSDTEFTMNINGNDITFTRNSSKDFTLWG